MENFFPPDRLNVCARGGVIGDRKKKKINLKHFFLFFLLIFSLFFFLLLLSPFCVFVLICFYDLNGL